MRSENALINWVPSYFILDLALVVAECRKTLPIIRVLSPFPPFHSSALLEKNSMERMILSMFCERYVVESWPRNSQ